MCIYPDRIDALIEQANDCSLETRRKLCAGIAKYLILKTMYKSKNINEGFMNLFYDFYGFTRQEKNINRLELMSVLQERNANELLQNVLERIALNGTNQFSYATKVLHTVNNDLPIYDSCVEKFTGLRRRTLGTWQTLHNAYDQRETNGLLRLVEAYRVFVNNPASQLIISYGNNDFTQKQALTISDVKKIDFMIWGFSR